MEPVSFMTVESGIDLVVSFAVLVEGGKDVISLILQRTPKLEVLLPPSDHGVLVSYNGHPELDEDWLAEVTWRGDSVTVITRTGRRFEMDVREVEDKEIRAAKKTLKKMNADQCFRLSIDEQ